MTGPPPAAVRLVEADEVSPLRSQALYHGLALAMTESSPDTIVLCRPAGPYFCVGFHQSPREELDLDWCRRQGYPVIQRAIGGGTVFLDARQLFYQCVFHRRQAPLAVAAIYRQFLTPAVQTLRALGLPACLEGVNEIEVNGRRIAGTGGGQLGEAVLVVGNLLFDFAPEVMGRAWRLPSGAFRRLAEEGLRLHLATLAAMLDRPPSEAEIRRRLVAEYEAGLGRPLVPGVLTLEEEAAVESEERRLARLDEAGAVARPRDSRLKVTHRVWVHEWHWPVSGGEARVTARLADGRVEAIEMAGGALSPQEAERRVLEALGR
ncbi:MAG TPA: biotin/lipoate A/B protein ligase family protein [Methylomirabilota bacterium]|nr:biotin/lipoate A/B protein ligase family protein [Methylomirabilota bacterium]